MDYKEKVIALLNSQELSKEQKEKLENIFPELAVSEDERIKREIVDFLKLPQYQFVGKRDHEKWIAWLEKHGEQKTAVYAPKFRVGDIVKSKSRPMLDARKIISIDKDCYWCEDKTCIGFAWEDDYELVEQKPTDKIDTKFKAGCWIVDDKTPNDVFCVIEVLEEIYKVIDIDGDDYHIPHCKADNQFHLWTIQDAKDGDVLVGKDGRPFIFNGEFDAQDDNPTAYCGINSNDKFITGKGSHWTFKDGIKPATKEQCDRLFAKMRESGYEWDADKKELKKIEVASKESEDERIKQEILELVSIAGNGNQFEEIKDWLEKQEQVFEQGYAAGAKLADKHPHWISVKDRKPKLKHSEDNMKYSDTVIVTDGNNRTSARWVHNTWAGWYGWYDDGDEELKGITQWRPMPELPKKGGEK